MADEEHDTARLDLDPDRRSSARSASLIVMSGAGIGRMYAVERGDLVLGRSDGAAIRLDDEGISRQHAKIRRHADGSISIIDLDSRNGTFVNMERIDTRVLEDGDKIQLGAVTILKFSLQSAVEERFARRLYDSATRDALTTAYNRRYFDEQLAKDLSYSRRHQSPLSLLMLDIDRFKAINDTHGHQAGDAVLSEMGRLVERSIRLEDVFCRIGGEEFAVIMRGAGVEQAQWFGERLRTMIESARLDCGALHLRATVSIGAATFDPTLDDEASVLVERADRALYQAKHDGRNRVRVAGRPVA